MTKKTRWLAATLIVAVLAAVGLFAFSKNPQAKAAAITTVSAQSLETASLPSGYQQASSLATGADGSVWFWSDSSSEAALFHWSPTTASKLTQVNLGNPSTLGLMTGIQNAIAVDSSGTIWIGANQSLVSYNPSTGAIDTFSIPRSSTDSVLAVSRPVQLASMQAITAMAASSNNKIAIATANSTDIQILNTANGSFSQVSLPDGTEATGVAYDSDGTLGIAETIYSSGGTTVGTTGSLLIVHPNGSQTNVPGIATINLASTGTGFLANDGQQTVSELGLLQASVAPNAVGTASGASTSARADGWSVVSSGVTAYSSASGIVANKSNGSISVIKLPTFACNPAEEPGMAPSGGPTTTTSATSSTMQCDEQAVVLTGSKAGLYAVLTGPVPTVAFLPAAVYQ